MLVSAEVIQEHLETVIQRDFDREYNLKKVKESQEQLQPAPPPLESPPAALPAEPEEPARGHYPPLENEVIGA